MTVSRMAFGGAAQDTPAVEERFHPDSRPDSLVAGEHLGIQYLVDRLDTAASDLADMAEGHHTVNHKAKDSRPNSPDMATADTPADTPDTLAEDMVAGLAPSDRCQIAPSFLAAGVVPGETNQPTGTSRIGPIHLAAVVLAGVTWAAPPSGAFPRHTQGSSEAQVGSAVRVPASDIHPMDLAAVVGRQAVAVAVAAPEVQVGAMFFEFQATRARPKFAIDPNHHRSAPHNHRWFGFHQSG